MATKYLWKDDQYCLLLIKKTEAHSQEWLKWKGLAGSSGDKDRRNCDLICYRWKCKLVHSIWQIVWKFPKVKHIPTTWPVIWLSGIYSSEVKTKTYTKYSCSLIYSIPKLQSTQMLINCWEWINRFWYIHALEIKSEMKELSCWNTQKHGWILESIMLNERSQTQKTTYCMIQFTLRSIKSQHLSGYKQTSGWQGLGVEQFSVQK